MSFPAPPSLPAGVDSAGRPVRLGETDSTGHPVGYIAPGGGLAWESEAEMWCATMAGAYGDLLAAWRATGGLLGPMPTPADVCPPAMDDETFAAVCADILADLALTGLLAAPARARNAARN